MSFPKQIKDNMYSLLKEPNLDNLREYLHNHTGEHNSIDFKQDWINDDKLAKLMLALANTKGGIVLFGVAEKDDGTADCIGIKQLRDKTDVDKEVRKFISTDLVYDIYNFTYDTSEYKALEGKSFQMLVVEDTPQHIPFMALKESTSIKDNEIYVRRGTSCEKASQEELREIFTRRMNYMHPVKGEPLKLEEHLKQLSTLYNHIEKEHVVYEGGILEGFRSMFSALTQGSKVVTPNPLYPDESYEEFISRMILEKKNKIERVLDLY